MYKIMCNFSLLVPELLAASYKDLSLWDQKGDFGIISAKVSRFQMKSWLSSKDKNGAVTKWHDKRINVVKDREFMCERGSVLFDSVLQTPCQIRSTDVIARD